MAEFDQPQACPDCSAPAPRLLGLVAIGGGASQADAAAAAAPSHAGGCACCMPRRLSAEAV